MKFAESVTFLSRCPGPGPGPATGRCLGPKPAWRCPAPAWRPGGVSPVRLVHVETLRHVPVPTRPADVVCLKPAATEAAGLDRAEPWSASGPAEAKPSPGLVGKWPWQWAPLPDAPPPPPEPAVIFVSYPSPAALRSGNMLDLLA